MLQTTGIENIVSSGNVAKFPTYQLPLGELPEFDTDYLFANLNKKKDEIKVPEFDKLKLEDIDKAAVMEVMNESFYSQNKTVIPEYLSVVKDKDPKFYLEKQIKGGSVVYGEKTDSGYGFTYMCKLFVPEKNKGLNIGKHCIDNVIDDNENLAWRCCAANEKAVRTYDKVIQQYGGEKIDAGDYIVYMIGIDQNEQNQVAEKVLAQPKTVLSLKKNANNNNSAEKSYSHSIVPGGLLVTS